MHVHYTIDTVKIVSVDHVSTRNVAHQYRSLSWSKGSLIEAQADPEETRKRRGRDQYTRIVSFCSNRAMFMISVSDAAKPGLTQLSKHNNYYHGRHRGSWQFTARNVCFIGSGAEPDSGRNLKIVLATLIVHIQTLLSSSLELRLSAPQMRARVWS